MNWIASMKAALRYVGMTHGAKLSAVEWTPKDADALRYFLSSDTGLKLRDAIQLAEINHANHACMQASPYQCGLATGWRMHSIWLLHQMTISDGGTPQAATGSQTTVEGAVSLREQFAP